MITVRLASHRYRVSRYLNVSNAETKGVDKRPVSRDLSDVIVAKLLALGLKRQPWAGRLAYDVHGLRQSLGVDVVDLDER